MQMTNMYKIFLFHWSITMYTGLSLVICIVWRHFLLGTMNGFKKIVYIFLFLKMPFFPLLKNNNKACETLGTNV